MSGLITLKCVNAEFSALLRIIAGAVFKACYNRVFFDRDDYRGKNRGKKVLHTDTDQDLDASLYTSKYPSHKNDVFCINMDLAAQFPFPYIAPLVTSLRIVTDQNSAHNELVKLKLYGGKCRCQIGYFMDHLIEHLVGTLPSA